MKILVTGFAPFGGEAINPSYEAVRQLPDALGDAHIIKMEIPVAFGKDIDCIAAALEKYNPDAVVCVGQAGGRTQITPEFVGINYMNARIPDNDGNQPTGRIVEDGPDAYFSTLPVFAMTEAAREAGIPAGVSYTAGTYCCNEVMYGLLHLLATKHTNARGGFIHVPYLSTQPDALSGKAPSMPLSMMVEGLSAMIDALIKNPVDRAPVDGTEA